MGSPGSTESHQLLKLCQQSEMRVAACLAPQLRAIKQLADATKQTQVNCAFPYRLRAGMISSLRLMLQKYAATCLLCKWLEISCNNAVQNRSMLYLKF